MDTVLHQRLFVCGKFYYAPHYFLMAALLKVSNIGQLYQSHWLAEHLMEVLHHPDCFHRNPLSGHLVHVR
jgi:hypothetical protein